MLQLNQLDDGKSIFCVQLTQKKKKSLLKLLWLVLLIACRKLLRCNSIVLIIEWCCAKVVANYLNCRWVRKVKINSFLVMKLRNTQNKFEFKSKSSRLNIFNGPWSFKFRKKEKSIFVNFLKCRSDNIKLKKSITKPWQWYVTSEDAVRWFMALGLSDIKVQILNAKLLSRIFVAYSIKLNDCSISVL